MKQFKRVSAFFLALVMIVGLIPAGLLSATATAVAVGDNVLHAVYSADAVTADGALNEAAWHQSFPLSATLKAGAVWDGKNLYLGLNSAAPAVTGLTVNGKAVTDAGVAGTDAWEIQIPLASVEIVDLSKAYTLAFTAGGVAWEGKLIFDTTDYAVQEIDLPALLDDLTPEYIFGRIDLNHVRYDLPLIAEFTSTDASVYPLTWVIGDEALVSTSGKVTRHATEAKSTTIALKVGGQELWSVTVTLDPLTVQEQASPENVDAAFSKSEIVIDGLLSEEGWRMSGRVLDTNKQLVAEYGFQWNQTHLFVAVDFTSEQGALELTLNGKTFTVEGSALKMGNVAAVTADIAVKDGVVEIAIPLQLLGLGEKIMEYGKSMDISVRAGSFTGAGKTLALTGIDWFVTDNRAHATPVSATKSTDAEHGVEQLENGWRLYDLYGGTNKAKVRSYISFRKDPIYDTYFYDRKDATRIEFDFLASALPVVDLEDPNFLVSTTAAYANSGFAFTLGERADAVKDSWTLACGVMNSKDGLAFVIQRDADHQYHLLGKQVGEKFSLGVEWASDDTLKVFVDGVLIHTFTHAARFSNSAGDASCVVNMRPLVKPASAADNHDVTITNIAFGKVHDNEDLLAHITFDDIRGQNETADKIISDLILPSTITNGQLDNEYEITWTSSSEAVDAATGKVTRPDYDSVPVTLTATLPNGETKSFELLICCIVLDNDNILHVVNDQNPAAGVGMPYTDVLFTFDTTNNSIIRILGSKQKVNFVVLNDSDDKARLNAESLTLWISDDNITYTQIKNFKLLQVETKWYLYDFETEGKYVKVHYTHFDGADADFTGIYGTMIQAGYEEVFGGGEAKFTESEYTLTNSGSTRYDYAWTISKKDLGITGSDASIRISLNGSLLYHYVDGENVIVRVPEIAAGASVKLTVQQSQSAEVLDIANKEGVYEITYGTRESISNSTRWYYMTLPAGTTFPDGSKLEKETVMSMTRGTFRTSTDGGYTWTTISVLNNAPEGKTPVTKLAEGGWIFDSVTGRIMWQTYKVLETSVHSHVDIIASDDGGKTWYHMYTMPCACEEEYKNSHLGMYCLSYSEGIQLSTYDGKNGPNVDFVFPVGGKRTDRNVYAVQIAYSRDAGETWQYSNNIVYHEVEESQEAGCSEAWIVEREDGVLILQARCQIPDEYGFALAYSVDHGLTWSQEPRNTDFYSINTQPVIKDMVINGENVIVSNWGGNNVFGGTSYMRNPLYFAAAVNEGDTHRNLQNAFFKTFLEGNKKYSTSYVTNQSVTKINGSDLYVSFNRNNLNDKVELRFQDFDKWFTRTKGAYDNFEHGTVQYEGWNELAGTAELSMVNARDKYSMKINGNTNVARSVPYLQNGKVSMDIFVAANSAFTLALQSALNPDYEDLATPIRLRVESGKLYQGDAVTSVGELKEGWNTLTFDLELTEDQASVAINNGKAIELPVNIEAGDYVCYITFGTQSEIYVDELLVVSELDAVISVTEDDQKAADKVIELIKAIEKAEDKVVAVKAARAAFDALTQTQADLVDKMTVVDAKAPADEALVNYYDVLVAAEGKLEDYAVEATVKKIEAIGTVTLKSKETIEAARAAYDALTAEQKKLVKNYETLTAAEATLRALEKEDIVPPQTGDTTPITVIVVLMSAALLGMVAVMVPDIRRKLFRS